QQYIQMDTSQILFICAGTFSGIDEIIKRRLGRKTIGFATESANEETADERSEILRQVTPEDLVEYGMIPEFVGRLPTTATLGPLDEESLVRVLTEPRNALCKQYAKLFELAGSELEFTDGALSEVAKRALTRDTGARALRGVVEEMMLDVMFELPEEHRKGHYVVTEEMVRGEIPIEPVKAEERRKESA
ncbi:MAG: AAA family ATPase, partial [Phycisphaerales bacterium]|nr:AAA family ATPase [Phycisphaerales bacterium]